MAFPLGQRVKESAEKIEQATIEFGTRLRKKGSLIKKGGVKQATKREILYYDCLTPEILSFFLDILLPLL